MSDTWVQQLSNTLEEWENEMEAEEAEATDKRRPFDRIWLQFYTDWDGEEINGAYGGEDGEVTWCQDRINDDDVEYVRADVYADLLAAAEVASEWLDGAHRNHGDLGANAGEEWYREWEIQTMLDDAIAAAREAAGE